MNSQEQLRKDVNDLQVQPPAAAWKRLESKLEAHSAVSSVKRLRIMGYAASVLVIIATGVALFSIRTAPRSADVYTMSIKVLAADEVSEGSIYDVQKVKDLNAYWER